MKLKYLILAAAVLLTTPSVRAQDAGPESIPFDFSIVPGFSIGGMVRTDSEMPRVDGVAWNLLAGTSNGLNGVAFGGLWNASTGPVHGAQFAGVMNTVTEEVKGAQFAGVLNWNRGATVGAQFSGVVNYVDGSFVGLQQAGVINTAETVLGVQMAGVANVSRGEANGAQFTGVFNRSTDLKGYQVAGVANIADEVRGAQIAGVVNIADRVRGLQLGVVNVSNENSGVPIGLLSYVRETGLEYEMMVDETGFVHTGIRSGTDAFSNYVAVGARAASGETYRWSTMVGLGWRPSIGTRGYGMVDGLSRTVVKQDFQGSTSHVHTIRLGVGYHLTPHLAVFGAPTLNLFLGNEADGKDLAPWSIYDSFTDDLNARLWPGFTFGFKVSGKPRF